MVKIEVLKPIIFLSEARDEGDVISVRDASLIKSLLEHNYVKLLKEKDEAKKSESKESEAKETKEKDKKSGRSRSKAKAS
ncbi:hypothetical protein L3V82_10330 [Thiotrichales bacterium 19S3-7]|nr:hypothetical protein [Thiotrichales bacterium 19S3-7]MCF6802553.1 hypothetical protein [Thiotrichales bacterium 19S3-11]